MPRGAIKAVIGPNGAGKTTLFNLIAGTIPPQEGEVLPGPADHRLEAPRRRRPGHRPDVPDHEALPPHDRARERHGRPASADAIGLPRRDAEPAADLARGREIRAKASAILEDLGLAKYAEETASNLSFGRQRLVEFARALATEPILLLLDEPAAGLNIYETKELSELILKIRDRGVTCLVVEHDMSLVMNISDEVVVLDQGQKIAEGPPRAIQRNPEVIRIYLGDDHAQDPES